MSEKIDAVNLRDLEERARKSLSQMAYDFYASGANDEITLRENRAAYERILLLPRVLVDVSVRDMSTTVLGEGCLDADLDCSYGASRPCTPGGRNRDNQGGRRRQDPHNLSDPLDQLDRGGHGGGYRARLVPALRV